MKGERHRICVDCGGQMSLRTISRAFCIGKKEIEIRGIEAYVCDECGEVIFANDEAKMIERIINAVKDNLHEDEEVLNLSETAEYLRVSNQTIYNMIKDKRIKAYKAGREWRFLRSDLLAYMNSSTNGSLLAAKGGETSKHDMEIIMQEIEKRRKSK